MNRNKERKLLLALLRAKDRPKVSASRRAVALGIMWVTLALGFFVAFQFFGFPAPSEWIAILVAFFFGIVAAVLGVRDAAKDQWPVVSRYMDFNSIIARLRELEA